MKTTLFALTALVLGFNPSLVMASSGTDQTRKESAICGEALDKASFDEIKPKVDQKPDRSWVVRSKANI